MAKQIGPSLVDRKILDMFANGSTPDEVERETGIPALSALARARDHLSSIDLWDEVEQRRLLAHSLKQVKAKIESFGDLMDPKLLQSYTNLVTSIDKIQDKARAITDEEMTRLAQAQAQQIVALVSVAYNRVRELLAEEYPEVNVDYITTAFYEAIQENTPQIEA